MTIFSVTFGVIVFLVFIMSIGVLFGRKKPWGRNAAQDAGVPAQDAWLLRFDWPSP